MKKKVLLALCASLSLTGCGLDVADLNNPSLESVRDTPTPAAINAAATGLLIGNRAGVTAQTGYVAHLGILGRESFTVTEADPRYVSEMLRGENLDSGSPAFGGSNWVAPYANIRNANTLLEAVEKVTGMTDAQKEGVRGFAKTLQALDFLVIINTRDENGAYIDVGGPIEQLAELRSKEEVFEHIASLLEEGKAHLGQAGNSFSFPLSSGYGPADLTLDAPRFNTPATFVRFNRALKARVEVYRGNPAAALEALGESFLTTQVPVPLNLGVFHVFSERSGDVGNALNNPNIFANPQLVTQAERKGDGSVDDRVTRKIGDAEKPMNFDENLQSPYVFKMYASNTAPVPIIRNEELILLRAEANIGLGTPESLAAAAEDINLIRTVSGGLAPRTDLDASNILGELLKQKQYSLLFEGGHRWIDLRRYNQMELLAYPGATIHRAFPIPQEELDARK